MCNGRVSISLSTSGTRRVIIVKIRWYVIILKRDWLAMFVLIIIFVLH
jgi:hypothetical protein